MIHVPDDALFGDSDFLDSPELAERAVDVQRRFLPELVADEELRVDYYWKRLGGASSGMMKLGQCQRLTGLVKHLSRGSHFAIWLAADHATELNLDDHQLEAILFHELCHVEVVEAGEVYRVRGHDCELFIAELERYGAWKPELGRLVQAARRVEALVREAR